MILITPLSEIKNLKCKDLVSVECTFCAQPFLKIKSEVLRSLKNPRQGRIQFCSRECAYTARRNKTKIRLKCLECGKEASKKAKKFCSFTCQQMNKCRVYIDRWLGGEIIGSTKDGSVSKYIKRYLKDLRGEVCEECDWNKVNPYSNKIPLEIDHIDGNWSNNHLSNLRILCPNCHSLTATYRALNIGKGRLYRKQTKYYKEKVLV